MPLLAPDLLQMGLPPFLQGFARPELASPAFGLLKPGPSTPASDHLRISPPPSPQYSACSDFPLSASGLSWPEEFLPAPRLHAFRAPATRKRPRAVRSHLISLRIDVLRTRGADARSDPPGVCHAPACLLPDRISDISIWHELVRCATASGRFLVLWVLDAAQKVYIARK